MTTASPADRYAATVGRRAQEGPELSSFRGLYGFALFFELVAGDTRFLGLNSTGNFL